jgi:hypothetical protein
MLYVQKLENQHHESNLNIDYLKNKMQLNLKMHALLTQHVKLYYQTTISSMCIYIGICV